MFCSILILLSFLFPRIFYTVLSLNQIQISNLKLENVNGIVNMKLFHLGVKYSFSFLTNLDKSLH